MGEKGRNFLEGVDTGEGRQTWNQQQSDEELESEAEEAN